MAKKGPKAKSKPRAGKKPGKPSARAASKKAKPPAKAKPRPASRPKKSAKPVNPPRPKPGAKALAPAKTPPAKHAPAKPAPHKTATAKAESAKSAKLDPKSKPGASAKLAAPIKPVPSGKPGDGSPNGVVTARKGITINAPKPVKKPKSKNIALDIAAIAGQLGNGVRKPLISSGPNAPSLRPLGAQGEAPVVPKLHGKTPFGKKDLERFRAMLIRKRAELLGDISHLEEEALRGESGSLSNLPQHMAEQGSETYEQSLHLDLAAVDRKLLKEIDEAIVRIDKGMYGICELTGKPIKVERLEELPWARYTIEAQRELERRSMRS